MAEMSALLSDVLDGGGGPLLCRVLADPESFSPRERVYANDVLAALLETPEAAEAAAQVIEGRKNEWCSMEQHAQYLLLFLNPPFLTSFEYAIYLR